MYRDIEDEDELLYGESGPQTDIIAQSAYELLSAQYRGTSWLVFIIAIQINIIEKLLFLTPRKLELIYFNDIYRWKKYMHPIKPTFWLFLTRDNGHFEIYSIPDFQLSYLVPGIGTGLLVLGDSLNAVPTLAQPDQQQQYSNSTSGKIFLL